jgi:hypothetical protein
MPRGAEAGGPRRTRPGAPPDLDAVMSSLTGRVPASLDALRAAVESLIRGREQQQLAEMQIRRGIVALADLGVPQREIASLAGISQAEVSRRLARRALTAGSRSPREVILQRKAGVIDTAVMIDELARMTMTQRTPGRRAAFDNAASTTGTAKQLISALHEGLLTEEEYEAVRTAIARRGRTPRR